MSDIAETIKELEESIRTSGCIDGTNMFESFEQSICDKNTKYLVEQEIIPFIKLMLQKQAKEIIAKVKLTEFAQEFLQDGASGAIDHGSIDDASDNFIKNNLTCE